MNFTSVILFNSIKEGDLSGILLSNVSEKYFGISCILMDIWISNSIFLKIS